MLSATVAAVGQDSDRLLAVRTKDNSGFSYIDATGKVVLPGPYQGGSSFSEGLAPVNVDGEWAYIDSSGEFVISHLRVRTAGDFVEGRAYVENFDNRYGYIDRSGREVVPMVHEVTNNRDIYRFSEGRVPVMVGDKWGYFATAGDFVIPPQYDEASAFSGGLARVRSGSQTLYIDPSGSVVLSTPLFAGSFFGGSLALVRVGNRWGYMDRKGQIAIAPQYEETRPFSEGLAAVKTSGKWNFIDPDSRVAFVTDADLVHEFSDGLVLVREADGKWNYLDKQGRRLSPSDFAFAVDFSRGLAKTTSGYINTSGKFIWKGPW